MTAFTRKKSAVAITIGDVLRTCRQGHALSLRDVSNALLIPVQQLVYLETDRFHAIPEEMYRELFLKTYATYLGLEWEAIKAQYDAHRTAYTHVIPKFSGRSISQRQLIVAPQLIRTLFLSIAISGCLAYLLFLGYRAVSPPSLVIWSPAQDEWSGIDRVTVRGKTHEQARLTINGESVMLRRDGTFEQAVVLSEGLNVITVGASKKYSKEHTEERRVLYRREHAYHSESVPFQN